MAAEGPEHSTPLVTGRIPAPGASRIAATAHQPVKAQQPGLSDPALLKQSGHLLEQRHGPVFEVDTDHTALGKGKPFKRFGGRRLKGDGLLQQQMAAGHQGLAGQVLAGCGGGGDHHRLDRGIGEHCREIGAARQFCCSHRGGEPISPGMPEGHRFGEGAGPQSRQMHRLTEAETGDGDTDRSHPSKPRRRASAQLASSTEPTSASLAAASQLAWSRGRPLRCRSR